MAAKKRYWLMKSEPHKYPIQQLKEDKTTHWDGVRNYQARNFMRDDMKIGDEVLFYHSNAKPPGVVGIAKIHKESYPDFTAFDAKDPHYDPKSKQESPTWYMVDVKFVKQFKEIISLPQLREMKSLEGMELLRKGSRLSVQPVEKKHFDAIVKEAAKQ